MRVALETGAEIVGCASIVDYEDGIHRENYSDISEGYLDKNQCIVDLLEQNRHAWGAVHNKLFKRSFWGDTEFPAVRHLEDYVVTSKLFNETNAIYFCAHPYYHHTSNTASLSMSGWNHGWLTIPDTTDTIVSYLMNNCSDTSIRNATYRFRFLMYWAILWTLYKGKTDDMKQIKKNLRSRSMSAFKEYFVYSNKKKGDIKLWIKFFLALV